YQDYTNIQAQIRDVVNNISLTLIRNAAAAKLYGGEAELVAKPSDELTLELGGSYLHAKYDTYFARTSTGALLDLSNTPFPAPKYTFTAGATYVVPVGNGEVRLSSHYNYIATVIFQPT